MTRRRDNWGGWLAEITERIEVEKGTTVPASPRADSKQPIRVGDHVRLPQQVCQRCRIRCTEMLD